MGSASSSLGRASRSALPRSPLTFGQVKTVIVKVFKAKVTRNGAGRLVFDKVGQAFITVEESTANVNYISSVVQKKWGPTFTLVTGNGLSIDDSSDTQGMQIIVLNFY